MDQHTETLLSGVEKDPKGQASESEIKKTDPLAATLNRTASCDTFGQQRTLLIGSLLILLPAFVVLVNDWTDFGWTTIGLDHILERLAVATPIFLMFVVVLRTCINGPLIKDAMKRSDVFTTTVEYHTKKSFRIKWLMFLRWIALLMFVGGGAILCALCMLTTILTITIFNGIVMREASNELKRRQKILNDAYKGAQQ